jgi:hypothetical protein
MVHLLLSNFSNQYQTLCATQFSALAFLQCLELIHVPHKHTPEEAFNTKSLTICFFAGNLTEFVQTGVLWR